MNAWVFVQVCVVRWCTHVCVFACDVTILRLQLFLQITYYFDSTRACARVCTRVCVWKRECEGGRAGGLGDVRCADLCALMMCALGYNNHVLSKHLRAGRDTFKDPRSG